MALIDSFLKAGHAAGSVGTRVARVRLYGTRVTPQTSAGHAHPTTSAIGLGPHSVWNGPRLKTGGAPIPKPPRPA